MGKYTVDPGARLLWCLRRRTSDVRCVLFAGLTPMEVHVFQGRDLVIKELFPDECGAVGWATAYADRLKKQGWRENPEDYTPSSAA